MKKSALLVGLFVLGILIGLSLRNPFHGEGFVGYFGHDIDLRWNKGYCFAIHKSGSIAFVKETGNTSECER